MFRNRRSFVLSLGIALGVILLSRPAQAANITFQGAIGQDDGIQLFHFTLATTGSVDVRSYGYGGGTASTGTVVPGGGFDTILTLFDGAGAFLTDNDEGAGVDVDPITGLAADARIMTNLTVGSYFLALSQYDNFAMGFNLADGFIQAGNSNFTADPAFTSDSPCASGMFRDISGTAGRCRTGTWTVDFVNVASASAVPEPGAMLLAGIGLGVLLLGRCRAKRLLHTIAFGFAVSLQAQSTGPDYSKVSDYLNGQRTLLQIQDLQVSGIATDNGVFTYSIKTSNSQQTNPPASNVLDPAISPGGTLAFSAMMFNQPAPVDVILSDSFLTIGNSYQNVSGSIDFSDYTAAAIADFNLDGYDDLAIATSNLGGYIMILTVRNVNDPTIDMSNIRAGNPLVGDLMNAIAVGDFNGDGKKEIAGLSVLPGGGLKLSIHSVDPTTLSIALTSSLILTTPGATSSTPITHVSIDRGRFNSIGYDQLVVAFATDSGQAYVEVIDFDPNTLTPSEKPQAIPSPGVAVLSGFIEVRTGKFALPGNPYDQIAYLSAIPTPTGGKFFQILSVDPTTLAIKGNPRVGYDQFPCSYGIAVGNFDNRQPDPLNPGKTQPNPNAQIAFIFDGNCGDAPKAINIYSADPNSFALTLVSLNQLPLPTGNIYNPSLKLVAADLQGRSLTLGEPMVVNISSVVTPSVVVGTPPMHVDFVSRDPVGGKAPELLNLSAVPEGFKATYEQDNSTGKESSSTSKSSWSFGVKESISGSLSVGDPSSDGLEVSDTLSAAQDLKGASESVHGTFQGQAFNLSTTTGFGDEVSHIDNDFNIWVYPVIGKTVCPAAKPNCQPSEQVPLTIQFSAPSGNALTQATQGQALQWYQPPWEPGNIFSYPANLAQLTAIYPDLSQLTTGVAFLTDSSTITQKTTWSVTTNDEATASSAQNYSFENDTSVNGSVGLKGAITGSAGFNLDVSGSFGFSKLTKNTTSLGLSTGLEVSKPGTFAPFQNFGYNVTPYVMGTTKPGGVVDSQPLSTDVQTFGMIRAMFTADPLASTAGGWWRQAYNQPDVALNHPSRWTIDTPGLTNPIPSNCLATGTGSSQMDCASLSTRSPANPWLSTFHGMRGFFISSGNFPGQGPQLETATGGDPLTLQARVYNYSFAPMPPSSEVHVRFYFTPWKDTLPINPNSGILISEETIAPIPAWSNVPGAPPNWVLATTKFDTSKFSQTQCGNVNVVFWVVVWMQTPDGKLVNEMPGHGLTAIPGALTSLADAAAIEECQSDGNCYSNNAGFYKQIFYLTSNPSPPSACTTIGLTAPAPLGTASVDIGKVELSANQVARGGSVILSTTLVTNGGHASGISANLYEGDPKKSGRLIAVDRIPHIGQGQPHGVQTLYRAQSCGVQQLFLVVNRGKPSEIVRRAPPLRVACTARR